jgi:small subunit ribosomal protein S20
VANIKSQIKRNRQNRRHENRNKAIRSRLKTEAKKAHASAESADAEAASARLRSTARLLDKAAAKGVIHRRTAARRKSKLARAAARPVDQG